VLVPSRRHREAGRVLVAGGFERVAYDLHSQTFALHGLKVDLHRYLRWAPAYGINEAAIWTTAQAIRVGAVEARTLSDDYTLVLLALGAFEDLGQGGELKQLVDLYLMLRQVDGTLDWEAFFSKRARENIGGIAHTVFALVIARCFAVSVGDAELAAARRAGHAT
jgi:hypothetical protein